MSVMPSQLLAGTQTVLSPFNVGERTRDARLANTADLGLAWGLGLCLGRRSY